MKFFSTARDTPDHILERQFKGKVQERQLLLSAGVLQFMGSKGIKAIPEWMLDVCVASFDATALELPRTMAEARLVAAQIVFALEMFADTYRDFQRPSDDHPSLPH